MKKFDQINVIPFIDIMLVLLAIILMTATFITQNKIEVNIPQSSSTITLQNKDIAQILTIKKNGNIYQNNKLVSIEQLESNLSDWDTEKQITLKVDSNASFDKFVNITDILSKNNLKKVSIITIKSK